MELSRTRKDKRIEKRKRQYKAFLDIAKLNEDDKEIVSKAHKNKETFKLCQDAYLNSNGEDPEAPITKKQRLNDNAANDSANPFEGKNLRQEDLRELRKLLKERYKALKSTPLFRLRNPSGDDAQLSVAASNRVPLFLSDLQHFALSTLLVRSSPVCPRWCVLNRAVTVSALNILFIENAGLSNFLLSKRNLAYLESNFPFQMEVFMPSAYSGNLVQEFFGIPLSHQDRSRAVYRYGSLEAAAKGFEVFRVLRAIFPVAHKTDEADNDIDHHSRENVTTLNSSNLSHSVTKESEIALPSTDKFPRTQLLLSAWQMLEEGYPMPINAHSKEKYKDFVPTKHLYKEVTNQSPMYGIDCEMCITTSKESECTRVSIVNEKLETVLDTLVMPYNRITNYLTKFSGISPAMMEGVTTRLEDVQKFIQENIEPDAIFVGQSLNFDLIALKMFHPYVIDTSVIFNVTGDRYRKSKLRLLTQMFLKEDIQAQSDGHDSVEDSSASLRLVQLKLSNSIDFGDLVLQGHKDISSTSQSKRSINTEKGHIEDGKAFVKSFFSYISNSTVIGTPEVIEKYVDFLNPKATSYEQDDGSGNHSSISENDPQQSTNGLVTCVITHQIDDVARVMAKKTLDNKFCIGHIKLSIEETSLLTSGSTDILGRLDSWVEQIHTALPMNGICMVVLCGLEKSSNGVCFLSLKSKKTERVNVKLTST